MSAYRCPYCRDSGVLRDRGRLYGDPDTLTPCDCKRPAQDWLTPQIEAESRAWDEADRQMAAAHPMEEEETECSE